jgi:hypothetical protein
MLKENLVSIEGEAKDSRRQSQEREAPGMGDVRKVVERLGVQLHTVFEERGRQLLAAAEIRRANAQLGAEVIALKLRVEGLEQDNRWVSTTNQVMQQDLGAALAEGSAKVQKDLTNMEQELAKLKGEVRTMKPRAEPPAPASSAPKPGPVKVSPLPAKQAKQFPRLLKSGKLRRGPGVIQVLGDLPDGIIAHLTRECGGTVHDCHVVDITSGSLETETNGANPHSGVYDNKPELAARNVADLEGDSEFLSAFRKQEEDIPNENKNNWICYDFKERRIVPTDYTIRTNGNFPGSSHLKSWAVDTSADGKNWREVAREEDNEKLNGLWKTATFPIAGAGECRFIRLVNIGRNHLGNDALYIQAWEIFGSLVE